MKKLIFKFLLGIVLSLSGNIYSQNDPTKTIALTYLKTEWLTTEDGEKVSVIFKKDDGTEVRFNEDASTFISAGNNKEQKEILFTDKSAKGNDRTNKENVGKKFVIEYYDFFDKIVSAKPVSSNKSTVKSPQEKMDSVYAQLKPAQEKLKLQNKCPNCAEAGAKEHIKTMLAKMEAKTGKERETKTFYEEALKENKFSAFYFGNSKALVISNYVKPGMGTVHPIKIMKVNNKWVALIGEEESKFTLSNEEQLHYSVWMQHERQVLK